MNIRGKPQRFVSTIFLLIVLVITSFSWSCGAAKFTVGALDIAPPTVAAGQEATATLKINNTGNAAGSYDAVLSVNGAVTETQKIQLSAGASGEAVFKLAGQSPGTYSVSAGGQSQVMTVVKPAAFQLGSIEIVPVKAVQGQTLTVKADVTNSGDLEGRYTARFVAEGEEIEVRDLILSPLSTQNVAFGIVPRKAGPLPLSIGDSTSTVSVLPPTPLLRSPAVGAVLDNGTSDFKDSEIWDFAWFPVPGATKYQIYVISATAALPVINMETTSAEYHRVENGYVANQNRFGWTWKVRAYAEGEWSEWSAVRPFDVEPLDTDKAASPAAPVPTPKPVQKVTQADSAVILDILPLLPASFIEADPADLQQMTGASGALSSDSVVFAREQPFQIIFGYMYINTNKLSQMTEDSKLRDEQYMRQYIEQSILKGMSSSGSLPTDTQFKLKLSYPSIGNVAALAEGILDFSVRPVGIDVLLFRTNDVYVAFCSVYLPGEAKQSLVPLGEAVSNTIYKYYAQ